MLAIARTHRSVVVAIKDLDWHRHLLACRNGTIDLRSGELLAPNREHLLTRGVDFEYAKSARSPEWESFLRTIFAGDANLIAYVRRLMGYCVTGEVGEHLLPIFHGLGGNGKSQFVNAIYALLGEHAAVAPEGLLVETRHEQHPERLATLRGRRFIVSFELERRAVLAESLVKSITGGDKISARHLYGQRFDFEPSHSIILVTNHPPRVHGTDEAIWRRLRMVPFTVTISPAERILDYGRLLVEKHGGAVLAWLVAGAVEWYRDGLGEAEQVRQATLDYRQREDVIAQFLAESTVPVAGRTKVAELHAIWREWAGAAGVPVGRAQDFTYGLESHGVELDTVQGARFARKVGILDKSAGQSDSVRAREGSSVEFPYTRAREEVYGRGVTSPHVSEKSAGQVVQEPRASVDEDLLTTDGLSEISDADESAFWDGESGDIYLASLEGDEPAADIEDFDGSTDDLAGRQFWSTAEADDFLESLEEAVDAY
jgi:putative DNA primase/helicase